MNTIGVFDSGQGGASVAKSIEGALPSAKVLFRNDVVNVPYGSKSPEQLLKLVIPILEKMVQEGCEVIVIACNTVTTTLIDTLRQVIAVPLVGIEPMVKPAAAMTKTGVIAVCATATTLQSKRYTVLKETYAAGITVLEPDCNQWAAMIENQQVDKVKIDTQIDAVCDAGADVIVLACTHYHWIEEEIALRVKDRAIVIQPEQAVIAQLQRVLVNLND